MAQKASFSEKLTKYNTNINIINGMMAIITANLVTPYFAKFAERLGAGDYHITLLSSLPAFISIFVIIPGAILIEGFKNKKAITSAIIFLHKFFYVLLALVPFINKSYQPIVFVILVGLMNFPGSVGTMGFQSSIGDIFNGDDLGRAMALRNRYSTIIGVFTTYFSARILSQLPKTEGETIILYQILFVVTFLIGLGEVISYTKFRGIKKTKKKTEKSYKESFKETLKTIPNEKRYIIFVCCSLAFYFGWQMGWPLFNIYTLINLKANEQWLGWIQIASSISMILTYTLWAKFAEKRGNNFALFIATIGMSITPFLYVISKSLLELVIFNIVVGVSVAGTTQILFNMLIEVTPSKNRTIYMAIYNTIINISAAISPFVGIAIKKSTSIYFALIITGILRFVGSLSFFASYRYLKK